jgi:hypothetical protein
MLVRAKMVVGRIENSTESWPENDEKISSDVCYSVEQLLALGLRSRAGKNNNLKCEKK